ncbi:2-amino-4-hydroxy-6-hydroxymethyldihydropteridine diphosphokinase [Occultella gossypii]|uniref:Bifunctional folate synthesis protein n=1 Tax=Occultella gossypii TaxID=2800820 RepID=A0ABS7SA37_9MICO|nr:2-amino-4-hydroxy-6-hydroxymethyldihydropteridine diphosphokinase [Occultella gossypii]MBZ2197211.1 2-amino-4-hydroxy-6-hydroxymethyldihydropteridine diphosphokinase [Occultella gossypii]
MNSEDNHAHDVIRLIGLGGVGRHGVLPEERRDGQTFLADVILHVDTRAAAASDDLADTVNYADVAQEIVSIIEGEPVNLIETLAARIADAALAPAAVRSVEVTVHKPEAPVGVPFTDVQITITRGEPTGAAAPVGPAAEAEFAAPAVAAAAMPAVVAPVAVPPAAEADSSFDGVPAPAPEEAPEAGGAILERVPDEPVEVVLSIGGNVGDVRATMRAAVADLREVPGLTVTTVSPLARTAAVVLPDAVPQPDFLNAVVLASTTLSPMDLLRRMHEVEDAYGRQRRERWGERTLDIDIVTFDGVSSVEPELTLPHPRANERAFVLVPWAQADPSAFLPGLGGGPVAVLAETAPDRSGVRWLALDWLDPTAGQRSRGPVAEAAPAEAPAAPAEDSSVHAIMDDRADVAPVVGAVPVQPEYASEAAAESVHDLDEESYQGQESVEDLELLAHTDGDESEPAAPMAVEQPEAASEQYADSPFARPAAAQSEGSPVQPSAPVVPPAYQVPAPMVPPEYQAPAPPEYQAPAPEGYAPVELPPTPQAPYEQPSYEQPSYGQHMSEEPSYGQHVSEQPSFGQPAEPAASEPSAFQPSGQDQSGFEPSGQDQSGFEPSGQDQSGFEPSGQDRSGYEPAAPAQSGLEPPAYEPPAYEPPVPPQPPAPPAYEPPAYEPPAPAPERPTPAEPPAPAPSGLEPQAPPSGFEPAPAEPEPAGFGSSGPVSFPPQRGDDEIDEQTRRPSGPWTGPESDPEPQPPAAPPKWQPLRRDPN